MANARGSRHTIPIGWGVRIAKVCQIHFTNKGTLHVAFPYQPDEPGIAAPVKVKPGKTRYPLLEEFARVTSHRIKWGSDQTSPTLLPNPACSS